MSYGKYGIDEEKKIILLEIAIKEVDCSFLRMFL